MHNKSTKFETNILYPVAHSNIAKRKRWNSVTEEREKKAKR